MGTLTASVLQHEAGDYYVQMRHEQSATHFDFSGFDSAGSDVPAGIREKVNQVAAARAMKELTDYTGWLFDLYGTHTGDTDTPDDAGDDPDDDAASTADTSRSPVHPTGGSATATLLETTSDDMANDMTDEVDPEELDAAAQLQSLSIEELLASLPITTLKAIDDLGDDLGTTATDALGGDEDEQAHGQEKERKVVAFRPRAS